MKQPGKPDAKKKGAEEVRRAHPGDHVFFHHPEAGPTSGHVVCCGKHGATVKTEDGQHHKVHWERVLGHKKRAERAATVVDRGEDGSICEDQTGKRFYLHGDLPEDEPAPAADAEEPDMKKSLIIFTSPKGRQALRKAVAGAAGLALRETTDKQGHQTKRWMKTAPDEKKGREPGKGQDAAAQQQPGHEDPHHEARQKVVGKVVPFTAGSFSGKGEVTAAGKDGVTVKDESGRDHQVHWHELHAGEDGAANDDGKQQDQEQGKADAEQDQDDQKGGGDGGDGGGSDFGAADYAAKHDQADIEPEHIYAKFGDELKQKLAEVKSKLGAVEETVNMHKGANGEYTPERQALHEKIVGHFLTPEKIDAATPADGQAPTFTILGGRGGSGKSWFNGKVYDPAKAITLDADEIKGMLPEYEGWNAHQVHEESGELFDHITNLAQQMGLNIVHDATMKTPEKAVGLVKHFKDAGYKVEAHYMHLPRQEAAKRAVSRFMGESNRYVPVEVVLSNTKNEHAFDSIKPLVDKWSFRDNNVEQGQEPRLIAQSGAQKAAEAPEKPQKSADKDNGGEPMTKAMEAPIMMLWRRKK